MGRDCSRLGVNNNNNNNNNKYLLIKRLAYNKEQKLVSTPLRCKLLFMVVTIALV